MKLQNDHELENTREKLAKLQVLIEKKEQSAKHSAAHEISLKSMKTMAAKLIAEIREFEQQHQLIR